MKLILLHILSLDSEISKITCLVELYEITDIWPILAYKMLISHGQLKTYHLVTEIVLLQGLWRKQHNKPTPEFILQRNILFQIYSEENTLTPAQHLQTSAGPKVNTAFTKELKVNSNQRTKKNNLSRSEVRLSLNSAPALLLNLSFPLISGASSLCRQSKGRPSTPWVPLPMVMGAPDTWVILPLGRHGLLKTLPYGAFLSWYAWNIGTLRLQKQSLRLNIPL